MDLSQEQEALLLKERQRIEEERRRSPQDRTRQMKEIIARQKARGFRPDASGGLRWRIDRADELLMRGLYWAVGDKAEWLPEYEQVADWLADNKGKGLLCIGDCGRGKTIITTRILPQLIATGVIRCEDGSRLARPEVFGARDLKERMEEILRQRIVIIDDLGTEPVARVFGETHNYFNELVNEIERRGKMLICSTNLTVEQLFGYETPSGQYMEGHYDERTKSRINKLTRRIYFEGDDMRR